MLVRVDNSYELKQDDVQWTPIGEVDGADEYIVASPGRMSIMVGNREVFFFRVNFQSDFDLEYVRLSVYHNGTPTDYSSVRSYVQGEFSNNATSVYINVFPAGGSSVIEDLEKTCNNGTFSIDSQTDRNINFRIRDFDSSRELMFTIGNVLVAFVAP